jgi:hypothetical protein
MHNMMAPPPCYPSVAAQDPVTEDERVLRAVGLVILGSS